jgi:ribosomal-protein-alanine N-acetyltransferase
MISDTILVRLGETSDLDQILTLDRATALAPHWSPGVYAAILGCENTSHDVQRKLIVSECDGVLLGYAVGLLHPPTADLCSRSAELESVVVAASARRAGIARALCRALVDWWRREHVSEITLEVRAGSTGAIALYTELGFKQIGSRPHYYHHPDDDAQVMSLRLPRPH